MSRITKLNIFRRPYLPETLDPDHDDGTMPDNLAEFEDKIVGHRIVDVVSTGSVTEIFLDNGTSVILADTADCCAHTELEAFLLAPNSVDHMVMGVGTTDEYSTWHIYADWGDILTLTVGWSGGNLGYYGYGFDIRVKEKDEC